MKKLLLLLLCCALLTGAVGCGKNPAATNPNDPSIPEESGPPQYVVDPMINQFIIDFNQQNRYTLAGLAQKGDLSCTATIDHCQLTITATKHGLYFTLTGGNEEAQRDRMLDVFYSVAQVADPTFTDAQAQTTVDFLKAQTTTVTNRKAGPYVVVNSYVPIIETNNVRVACRMDFTSSYYLSEE